MTAKPVFPAEFYGKMSPKNPRDMFRLVELELPHDVKREKLVCLMVRADDPRGPAGPVRKKSEHQRCLVHGLFTLEKLDAKGKPARRSIVFGSKKVLQLESFQIDLGTLLEGVRPKNVMVNGLSPHPSTRDLTSDACNAWHENGEEPWFIDPLVAKAARTRTIDFSPASMNSAQEVGGRICSGEKVHQMNLEEAGRRLAVTSQPRSKSAFPGPGTKSASARPGSKPVSPRPEKKSPYRQ